MLTRHCPTCGATKPVTDFFFRDRARLRPQFQCKDCTNQYKRDWYAENRSRHTAVSEAAKRRRIASNLRGEKFANISKLVRDGSWHAIVEEIAKCDVRCANCHRCRTAKVEGWYSSYP